MAFIAIAALVTLGVAAFVLQPLWRDVGLRGGETGGLDAESSDMALYRAQLDELEQDVTRGTIDATEAERARTEIARRLLSADRQRAARGDAGASLGAPSRLNLAVAGAIALALIGGTWLLYERYGARGYTDMPRAARLAAADAQLRERPSQAEFVAQLPAWRAPEGVDQEYIQMVERLREVAAEREGDLQGQQFLARHEAQLRNFSAAAAAQAEVLRIKGDTATNADRLLAVDLMVFAAQGYVSPEAEALLRKTLQETPDDPSALHYIALLYDQIDRPDVAFRIWRDIVESGVDTPQTRVARQLVGQAAMRAGTDYTPPAPAAALAGPSAADMEAAAGMSAEDRQAMIEGMVEQLSDRLASEGGSAAEWARLIGALGVLGQTDRAAAILAEARQRFADRPDELDIIEQAATQAGLAE